MGATLEVVSVFTDTVDTRLSGLSDLEITTVDGLPVLLVGSEAESALSSFSLADPGNLLEISRIEYSEDSGTHVLTGMDTFTRNGSEYVIVWGRYDDNYSVYEIDETGGLTFDRVFAEGTAHPANGRCGEMLFFNDVHFFFTADFLNGGLFTYRYQPDGAIYARKPVWDGNNHLGDITGMESGVFHGKRMLLTASALDAGIHVFSVSGSGNLTIEATYTPSDGLGFNTISEIEIVDFWNKPYLVVAGAGTDSLHVLKLKPNYSLKEKDTYIDTHETRFAEISCIETVTYGNRSFILVAGADEGVTLFELGWRGQLILLDVLTDDFGTTLADISDLEVLTVDNIAYVYVASASEPGLTVLSFDMERDGKVKKGNRNDNTLNGGSGDDYLVGKNGQDTLKGFQGDDRLVDGRGLDELTGGSGADVFVFQPDNKKDWIMDFEPGIDRIDLSGYDNTWHISSLKLSPRDDGSVVINVGDDKIHVIAKDGYEISPDSFTQDDFIFG